MFYSISDSIRKIASMIETDDTPYEGCIGDHAMLIVDHSDRCKSDEEKRTKKIVAPVTSQILKPTAPPEQRRPRKQPSHHNKWNPDTKTDLMRSYMQEYRADGKDKEVDGPKSTYKKKLK